MSQVDWVFYGAEYEAGLRPSGSAGSSCETAGRLGDGQLGRRDRRGAEDQDDPRTRTRISPTKVHVLPSGADTDTFTPVDKDAIRSAGLDPRCQYVVFIGLFAPWVDFDVMLTAFAEVGGTRPDARLVLVGDGAERPRVNALIDELDLGDRVLSTGFVAEQERVKTSSAQRPSASSHSARNCARIVARARSSSRYFAAAAHRWDGSSEMSDMIDGSGAGVTVPPNDATAMARVVGELLDDPRRADKMGAAGRRAAEDLYSWRSIVERTLPLLRDQG